MTTIYNFSAGPAMLPHEVLLTAQNELLNYQNSGMSVMELSHRSSLFDDIITDAEKLLRELMAIPDNYRVLFLQGGASLQFTMVPLNLAAGRTAYYINSGSWAKKAIAEAHKISSVTPVVAASSEEQRFTAIPSCPADALAQDAAYLHITTNNTIEGTAFQTLPETGGIPLVADMSSNILSNDYDVRDFGLIYAGAQKNIGPAGLTVVIVREDLLQKNDTLPAMLNYTVQAENRSLYNTPPTYSIYIAKLVFEWLKEKGGVQAITEANRRKAGLLYDYIDQSAFFTSPVNKADRSLTNIPFIAPTAELDQLFVKEAAQHGLVNLKGHRSVGGMRASLYNAMPLAGVEALVAFMTDFEHTHGGNQA